jgi:hypothetical protein
MSHAEYLSDREHVSAFDVAQYHWKIGPVVSSSSLASNNTYSTVAGRVWTFAVNPALDALAFPDVLVVTTLKLVSSALFLQTQDLGRV